MSWRPSYRPAPGTAESPRWCSLTQPTRPSSNRRDAETLGAVGRSGVDDSAGDHRQPGGRPGRQPHCVVGLSRGLLSGRLCRRGHVRRPTSACAGEPRRPRLVHPRGHRVAAAFTTDPPATQRHDNAPVPGAACSTTHSAGQAKFDPGRIALALGRPASSTTHSTKTLSHCTNPTCPTTHSTNLPGASRGRWPTDMPRARSSEYSCPKGQPRSLPCSGC